MKRRKFLKSILATALAAVVPFKIGGGDDIVKKWASKPRFAMKAPVKGPALKMIANEYGLSIKNGELEYDFRKRVISEIRSSVRPNPT